jgi:hypothetical protein
VSALTLPVADRIRELHASGRRLPEIAEATGIHVRMVNEVVRGRREGRPLNAREQWDDDERTGWAPLCLDAGEWALWRRTNNTAWGHMGMVARPCADCPIGFAADMRAVGRCNGTPGWTPPDEEEPAVTPAEETTPVVTPFILPRPDGSPEVARHRASVMAECLAAHDGNRTAAAAELGITTQVLGLSLVKAGLVAPRTAPTPREPKNRPSAKVESVPVPPALLHTVVEAAEPPRHAPEMTAEAGKDVLLMPEPPRTHQRTLDALRAAAQSAAALEDDLASAAMWSPMLKSLSRAARRLRRDIAVAYVDRT